MIKVSSTNGAICWEMSPKHIRCCPQLLSLVLGCAVSIPSRTVTNTATGEKITFLEASAEPGGVGVVAEITPCAGRCRLCLTLSNDGRT
jgi:hypothetical protein